LIFDHTLPCPLMPKHDQLRISTKKRNMILYQKAA
jgi:hypothetical protein